MLKKQAEKHVLQKLCSTEHPFKSNLFIKTVPMKILFDIFSDKKSSRVDISFLKSEFSKL